MSNLPRKRDSDAEILIYQTEDQQTRIRVLLDGQTVWLSQKQMAELFQTSVPNINMHVGNVFNEGELEEDSVVKEYLITAADGKVPSSGELHESSVVKECLTSAADRA